MHKNQELRVCHGAASIHIKMAALSLTEEMFAIIQGLSYSDSMKYVSPGSGLQEGMFSSLEQSQYYDLDTRLTFKGYQRKRGMRRKTMTNPTMLYTMFSVFAEDSPQQVRRNMVQWINENRKTFESQTLLAFAAKDSSLDLWLSNIDSNSTPGDEFALFALCQMYTRHALIVTSNRTWTSVHPKHGLSDHDLRRKCDLHLIYLGGDAFGILKPKFEWKVDVPVGHIEMIEPPDKPLQDTTEETLSKEASASNIPEIKEETVDLSVQAATELQDVMQGPNEDLPDATTNLIVALPPDMQLSLYNDPPDQQSVQEIVTRPYSVKLSRCDIVVSRPIPSTPIEVNVVVKRTSYDLRTKDTPKGNKATSTTRSRRSVSQNVSYVNLFQDSSSNDTANETTVQPLGAAIKREPSH